ncbi:hypothetical protein [Jiangella endophytica]|uniref:hypothetical protein n=1 Tax=Jiangella endophytica TaxID=1623398 RepID=UPI000E34BA9F|nr:hypothetical protein [Jiangella endophytica]
MTDLREAPPSGGHRWPAWALPVSIVAGLGAAGVGAGLAVARYGEEPGVVAFGLGVLLVTVLFGAGVVSRAMRHERRRHAVTEIAVILGIALLFYAGSPPGRIVLAGLAGGGLFATARTIRRDRRQATKMQNGWPDGSA